MRSNGSFDIKTELHQKECGKLYMKTKIPCLCGEGHYTLVEPLVDIGLTSYSSSLNCSGCNEKVIRYKLNFHERTLTIMQNMREVVKLSLKTPHEVYLGRPIAKYEV